VESNSGTVPEDAQRLAEHAAIQVVSEALEQYHLEVRWIAADYENPD
jgi:tRNA A37 threonylcarbamoyltransferase TsaD